MSKFISKNRKISRKIYKLFPQAKFDIFKEYIDTITTLITNQHIKNIVDVGAGKQCLYVNKNEEIKKTLTIVGVDISMDELSYNNDIYQKLVCDITKEIPLPNEYYDLVTSSSVIEHLKNTEDFIMNANKILKKDAYFISMFPCKFALFAILNQLIPRKISRILLDKLTANPEILGFEAFYNKCYYSAILKLLEKHGFEIVSTKISYQSSEYFSFFIPIFILSAVYELIIKILRFKNLSSFLLVVAKKK